MPNRIAILALDDCFASNVMGAIDLFNTANVIARFAGAPPPFEWRVVSPHGRPVRTSSGRELPVDGGLEAAARAKVIMIPAFGSPDDRRMIAAVESQRPLLPWLRRRHKAGVLLAAMCSGTFLLAECGVLDGQPATTSWWLASTFRQRYPRVDLEVGSMLTDGEHVLCAGTGMSHLDLALHLIERLAGRDIARACAKYTVLDDQRRSQAPFMILNHTRSYDPLVTRAEKWLKARLGEEISLEELAASVAVSPRTLARRFKAATGGSPQEFLQKLRIEAGKALLENTDL